MARLGIEKTHFTLDVMGRYTCNTDAEAVAAMDRPDARPFDVIVIGGGSFGPILAENVFFDDKTHSRRVLVLDAGPLALAEHQQNLPVLGDVESVVREVPWQADANLGFAGLRVMLGGRSVFFGGWSPQLLDDARHTEMPRALWPDAVVRELKETYFPQAAQQLAVDETNDFIFGELHELLRQRLAAGIDNGRVAEAIPLDDLELRLKVDPATPGRHAPAAAAGSAPGRAEQVAPAGILSLQQVQRGAAHHPQRPRGAVRGGRAAGRHASTPATRATTPRSATWWSRTSASPRWTRRRARTGPCA